MSKQGRGYITIEDSLSIPETTARINTLSPNKSMMRFFKH
jgi:hypothetical protein